MPLPAFFSRCLSHNFSRLLPWPIFLMGLAAASAFAAPAKGDASFRHQLEIALQKNLSDAEAEALLDQTEQVRFRDPKNPLYTEAVGLLHFKLKRWDNAKIELSRLAKPTARAFQALARCYYELGEYRRAAQASTRAGDPTRSAETWQLYNLSLQNAGSQKEALAEWERFRQRFPAPPEALEFLVQAYRRPAAGNKEKLSAALEEFLRVKKGTPEEAPLLLEAAALVPPTHPHATEYRVRALKLRGDDPKVWRELAECYDIQHNAAKAAEAYQKAAPFYSTDGEFLLKAAQATAKADPIPAVALYLQCLPLLPRDPKVPLELGHVQERLSYPDKAVEAYAEALRRDPGQADAKARMLALAASAKDPGNWLTVMVETEKKNPKDANLQFQMAKAFWVRHDTAEAYKYLEKALRNNPDRREFRQMLPKVITQPGQITRNFPALETLRSEGEASPELLALLCQGYSLFHNPAKAVEESRELLRKDPARLAGIRSVIFDAKSMKDAALALQLCDNYLAQNPKDTEVRRLQVEAAVATHAPAPKQREAMLALMNLDPSEDAWLLQLAGLDLAAKDSAAAFAHAEAWTHIHPDDAQGQSLVRNLAKGRKDRGDAYLASLDHLSRLDTTRHAAYEMEIASHYLAAGEPGKAVEIMGRLAPDLPNDAVFWYRYGTALQHLGRESAPAALERAWRLEPANADFALAFARVITGDSALAANTAVLKTARQKDPGSKPLRIAYARACYLAGNAATAATEWDEIAQRDPGAALEDTTAALSFLRAGQDAKAAALLEQRSAQYPHETQTLATLSDLYARQGREREMTHALERLTQEDFGYGDYPLRLARVKEKAKDYPAAVRLYSMWCPLHAQDRDGLKAYHDAAAAARDSTALLDALGLLTRFPDADRAYRFQQAEIFYARGGDPTELERLTRENPDYRNGKLLLVREYQGQGDFKNLARFEGFLEQESQNNAEMLEPLADLKAAQGEWEAAHKAYFAWLSVRPKDAKVFDKVLSLAREHQSPYLVSILRMGVERNTADTALKIQYAGALGKTVSALAMYQSLLEKRRQDLSLLQPAAELAKGLGRNDLAIPWYEMWAKLQPDDEKPWQALVELRGPAGGKPLAEALTGLQRLEPGDGDLALRLARLEEQLGQWDIAMSAYHSALFLNPKDRGIRDKLIELLRRHAPREMAADLLTEMQTLDSGAHEAQFELARLYTQRGDKAKAYAYLSAALEKSPRNANYLSLLPHTLQSREQILRHFAALQDLEMSPGLDRNDSANAHLFLDLARGYVLKGKWDAAAERFEAAYRLQPKLVEGDREALVACFKGKQWPLTADLSERYFQLHPDFDKEVLQMQILAYEKTRKGDAAIRQTLSQLLTFDRDNAGALLRIAELDLRAHDTLAAQAHIRECMMTHPNEIRAYTLLLPLVERKPDQIATYLVVLEKLAVLDTTRRVDSWRKLADLYESRKNYREAHSILSLLTPAQPKDPTLWYRLGKMRTQIQLGDMGVSAFRKAWELAPENLTYARTFAQTLRSREEIRDNLEVFKFLDAHSPLPEETRGLARAFLFRGDYAASATAWDRVFANPANTQRVPVSTEGLEAAEAYMRTRQWAKALPFFERRLPHEPQPLPLLDTLEGLYSQLHVEDKRIKALQHVVHIDPTYKDFQLRLAQAKEKNGEPAEALVQYAAWTERHPADANALLPMRQLADSLRDTSALETALRSLVRLPKPLGAHICQYAELQYRLTGDPEPLARAVKTNPGFTRGKLLLAREYFRHDEVPKLAAFEPEMAAASSQDPEWMEPLADLYAFENKKDPANASYLALLRSRRKAATASDTGRAAFRNALDKGWRYAEVTASPALAEELALGYEVFPEDVNLAHALGPALGANPKALSFYQGWLKKHTDDMDLLPRAADVAVRLQDWTDARAWYGKWTQLQPAEIAAWKGLRLTGEKTADLPTQIAALEKISEMEPDDPAPAYALGLALAKRGDRERALEYLVRASDLKPNEKTYAQEVQANLEQLADSALRAGNRGHAAEWYALLLERVPGHRKASLYQGLALADSRDFAGAEPLLKTGLTQSAEPVAVLAEGWRQLGQCEAEGGKPEPARQAFEKALSLNPKDTASAQGVLNAVLALDQKDKLPAAYAGILRVDSNQIDALTNLSALRLAAGAYAEAEILLRRLSLLHPDEPAVFADRGQALQALNRFDEAKAAFSKAYDLGDRRPEVVGSLVRLHHKTGSLQNALPVLEEWLRQSPQDDEAATWGAEFAEQRRDWRQAEEMWALVWQADPTRMRALEGLGRSYVRRGENEFGAQLLEPYADKLDAEGLALLADAYAAIPESDKAVETYRKARLRQTVPHAIAGEALVELKRKRIGAAKKVLRDNHALDGNLEIEKARIRLYLLQCDFDRAAALAKGLSEGNPQDAEAQSLYGEALLAKRDGSNALAALAKAGKLDTTAYQPQYLTGMANLQLDRNAEANAIFFALGEKSDAHARAAGLWGLGETALKAGKDAEAKDYWTQSLSLNPTPEHFSKMGSLCVRLKQLDEAEGFAQRALEIEEDFPEAVATLSEAMVGRTQTKDAKDYLQEALRKNPESCDLLIASSRVLLELGEWKSLNSNNDQARQSCPDDPRPWLFAGLAATKSEKPQDATTSFTHYRQLGGDPKNIPAGF